jgi:hypothetical protein
MTKIINTEFWSLVISALPGFIAENRGQMRTQLGLVQHIVLQNMMRYYLNPLEPMTSGLLHVFTLNSSLGT